jgi:hypothetical protein
MSEKMEGRLVNSLSYSILGETMGGTGYTVKVSNSSTSNFLELNPKLFDYLGII